MSTLSGMVSKGEKGKPKFQSLDINSLYRVSRGESLEQQQQKSTLPRKHGMQSLGKVPSARRPPANLPSLKSEHSSSDPAVSLVPSGGSGWATTKDVSPSTTSATTTTANFPDNTNTNSSQSQCAVGTTPALTTPQHPTLPGQPSLQSPHPSDVGNKSSWSAIMSRPGDVGGGMAGQQQQQSQQNRELNAQYGPGPSLRPQTEGSWIQGGSRTAGGAGTGAAGPGSGNTQGVQGPPTNTGNQPGHTEGLTGGRPNLGQSQGMGLAQAGPHGSQNQNTLPSGPHQVGPNMHHYRGLIAPFMYRGSFPPSDFPSQFPQNVGPGGPRPRINYLSERFSSGQRQQQDRERQPPQDDEQIITRPIIKEEELTKMDDISRDAGWAAHDDIDYNQKLAFSDDELELEPTKEGKKELKEEKIEEIITEERDKLRDNRDRDLKENRDQTLLRSWNQNSSARDFRGPSGTTGYSSQQQLRSNHPLRGVEEEEIWNQRRREQGEKVASAVERARQRKEEEEKRFQEATKQAAALKLQNLEQKLKEKQAKQKDDDLMLPAEPKGLISVPPVPIPVPEWEREKENRERESRERSRTSSEGKEEKRDSREQLTSEFRDRTSFTRQIETPRTERERERDRDRDQREMREREPPAFSRQFQHNLPPRFQKQQAERSGSAYNRVSPNAERSASQPISHSQQMDLTRWVPNHNNSLNSMKISHPMPPSQRRSKDSDVSSSMDEERPPSRDHRGPPPRDDRYRHASHRPYDNRKPSGYYDDYNRGYKDYEYEERHSRDSWERERHYDDKGDHRETRDAKNARDTRDSRDNRHISDSRDVRERDSRDIRERDAREKKDYDTHVKSPSRQDSFDDREGQRERTDGAEWRDDRRDMHDDRGLTDRSFESRRNILKDERSERGERNERPQRPDSRDSRTSRESRTSLREEDFHKSRDSGSWINDLSDYEEKKSDIFREDMRERERERDRRQPPGPVTREKLEADELKSEKRSLTQLKRGTADQEKKESTKESPVESKKEVEAWSRKLERASENRNETSKAWADAVSPTLEKEEDKLLEPIKDDKIVDLQQSMEKLCVDKKEGVDEETKDDSKDDHREKSSRNRTNSGSSRGRDTRGRQWGAFNVYNQRWRGAEPRGRRGGTRISGRPGSARSGSYVHTDSEISGDEISSSAEFSKEERRPKSPKPPQKGEKEDRNREMARRDDKRNDYSQPRTEKRGGGGGGGGSGYDGRSTREGFAPSGEPSRRGRGGYRIRGATAGGRMEGYGPPSSKSPFSSERSIDEKNAGQQNPPTPTSESDTNVGIQTLESTDDKIIAKQQALTAGITGRHTKSPNQGQQVVKQETNHTNPSHGTGSRSQARKDDSRTKRNHSGNRKTRDSRETRFRGSNTNIPKQNSSDVGNEDWETTSENSDELIDDRKDSRSVRNKQFNNRGGQNQNQGVGPQSRRNEQSANNRDQREKSSKSSSGSSRALGAEKRNAQNSAFSNQRNSSGNIPPLMQNVQTQNGRPRSQGSANSASISGKSSNKESTVNRVDEIKLNDPNLVSQALNDMNKKSMSKDKKSHDGESDTNNYSTGGDEGVNSTEDKVDSDGFQEVRSKKNVKDSRHNQKDEPKSSRREKDKERERDRSKSKSNGRQPTPQQVQNIPPLLGQPIPQPANMPQKPFDRNASRQKLAPRFQKQRLAKQQQQLGSDSEGKSNNSGNYMKDSSGGPAPPPSVNAWDKPFTSQLRSNSPSNVPADIQLMSGLTGQSDHIHENNEQTNSTGSSQRNSPNCEKAGKIGKDAEKNISDASSPPVQTLIFENTNYSKTTKTGNSDLAMKSKYSNHMKPQSRMDKRGDLEEDGSQIQQHQHQQQALSAAFSNKPGDIMKEKNQEPIQMPLSFNNKTEDSADMKLDFAFDSDLSQLTEDKSKSLGMPRSIHMTGGQSSSTAELNLKIASVKKVWENAPPMPTVVEHEDGSVVSTANSFPQAFESNDVDDSYSPHQQYNQNNMKNEIATSTNVCKVKPQQQSSGGVSARSGSSVPGPNPIGPGQSPIGHPPVSLQGPLSPPPFNSTGQPSHINYQEFPQYPGSQAAQYGNMSAIPSPPAMLYNTGSGQLPAQAGGLYGAFQLDQSRSPFTQYPPYAPSLQNSYSQQNVYLQQAPPPHAQNAPAPDMYQSNLSQYRITAAGAPPFGQNQQLSNNPNTVLISSSSNSLMSASVKPSSQPIGAIGTKAPHFQAPSAPQPNQLAYIPYDPNQVLGVSGSYMGNSQLVQRPGPNVQPSANSYYSATSADVFPGSQTGFYQPGGAGQQTGTHYGLQGFGQHNQSLATGNAAPVGLQNFSSQFLSGSGLQIAAAAAQQYRNPTGGLPGPANAAATFLSKHQQQEQPRQLKSPSGNQQDVLTSVFGSTSQIPSPKSRKQQASSQQPQPSPTQHHKYQQYQGVSQSALVSSYTNYVLQQNVRGMGMPPRANIQPSQQRYPAPIQRPVVPFPPGPNPNNPSQQQQNCMPTQQQQTQMNRHRSNLHQQQQQQRNMKMQQQYYSGHGNVKMDSADKVDTHSDKITENNAGNQPGSNKSAANQQDSENKEEVNQQNE